MPDAYFLEPTKTERLRSISELLVFQDPTPNLTVSQEEKEELVLDELSSKLASDSA